MRYWTAIFPPARSAPSITCFDSGTTVVQWPGSGAASSNETTRRFGALSDAAIVAHVYVYSDAPRKVQFWCGSDDGIKITVNGVAIHRSAKQRGCVLDTDKTKPVPLKQGWNSVFVTVSTGGGDWRLSCT